jgi:hypothetical protein
MVPQHLLDALVCWFLDRAFIIKRSQDMQEYCQLHHGAGCTAERVIIQHDGTVLLHGDWRRTAARLAPLVEATPEQVCLFDAYVEVSL